MSLSIAAYAAKAGISTPAVRYYEREGLLPIPSRRSGRRIYAETDLGRLKLIVEARKAGFEIQEIRQVIERITQTGDVRRQLVAAAEAKAECVKNEIRRLQLVRQRLEQAASCSCASLDTCHETLSRLQD